MQSRKDLNRTEWQKLNLYIREGDMLVIKDLFRLNEIIMYYLTSGG